MQLAICTWQHGVSNVNRGVLSLNKQNTPLQAGSSGNLVSVGVLVCGGGGKYIRTKAYSFK